MQKARKMCEYILMFLELMFIPVFVLLKMFPKITPNFFNDLMTAFIFILVFNYGN